MLFVNIANLELISPVVRFALGDSTWLTRLLLEFCKVGTLRLVRSTPFPAGGLLDFRLLALSEGSLFTFRVNHVEDVYFQQFRNESQTQVPMRLTSCVLFRSSKSSEVTSN